MFFLKYIFIWVCLLTFSWGQDANCDFFQNVQPGQTYYIYSPGYPNKYKAGISCRWIAKSTEGYNVKINCPEILLPQSPGCAIDALRISISGDPQLSNADVYCGTGSVSKVSTGRIISVGLTTTYSISPGGRFHCSVTAQPASIQPTKCSCGYKMTNRIVGGAETGINEYPMMAGVVETNRGTIICGATIISERYVLTAAHCVYNRQTSNYGIIVGDHDLTVGSETPAARAFKVLRVTIHRSFNPQTRDYDIASLETSAPIQFSNRVGPVCLPFKFRNYNFAGATVTALGFGGMFPGGPDSTVLRKVDLKVTNQQVCQTARPPYITNRQICTLTPGRGTCQHDNGGPLIYQDSTTGRLFLLGIISNTNCATDTPGVSTRITEMLDWIVSVTGNYQFCKM